jgi:glycolate oxidase FAD binding subunit
VGVDRVSAGDARAVADAIAWANAGGKQLAIEGAGTKAAIGNPIEADLVVSTAALGGIVSYEPSELTLTARPGTPLAEIEAVLAQSGQHLAFEPMDHGPLLGGEAGGATLGGVIGAAAAGPRRIRAGSVRDHLLGFSAVSGRGEMFKAGGKVVKNVTGYDLSKLMAGAWGTLAVLTEVTAKVLPRPPEAATLLYPIASADDAAKAMSATLGVPAEVSGAAHLPADIAARAPVAAVAACGCALTAIRIEGVAPAISPAEWSVCGALPGVELAARLDRADTEVLWRWIRDVGPFVGDARQVWRLSLSPMDGPPAARAIAGEIDAEAFFDWAGGQVWLACADVAESGAVIRAAAEKHGGTATLVSASEAMRRAIGAFHREPPALAALSARVKASFDPNGVLNPGRLWREA